MASLLEALGELLGGAGYALDTPGALLRGLLAGRPGERASGTELLQGYGMEDPGLLGMGVDMALDPLAIAGPAFGALKGLQGARAAAGRVGQMAGIGDELAGLSGLAGKFGAAADTQRAASMGHADEFIAKLQGQLGPLANPVPDPNVWGMLPNESELGIIARRAGSPGAARTDSLVGGGMKSYTNYEPRAAMQAEMMGLGGYGDKGKLNVIPNVTQGSKGAKATAPAFVDPQGGKAFLDQTYHDYLPPDDFPVLPYEGMLRQAGQQSGQLESSLLAQLQALLDPNSYGLWEDLFMRGAGSPLGMAALGGVGAGGAYGVGNQIWGQ